MSVSWRFLAGTIGGFFMLGTLMATAFYLNLGVPVTGTSAWVFQINEHKRHVAEQKPSPKLLVVGGSSALFGISAKELEKQTGWPAVNLGNNAALGPIYMLHLTRQVARSGDTVLLAFEYDIFAYGRVERAWADSLQIDYIVSRDPEFFHHLTFLEQWNVFMLTSTSRLIQGLKHRSRTKEPLHGAGMYDVRLINDWGDQTHHTAEARTGPKDLVWQRALKQRWFLPAHPKAFPFIEAFCQWAQAHQIRVLATFPNVCQVPDSQLADAGLVAKKIKDFYASIGVPVVGDFTNAMLPPDQFFDSVYHPTEEAAKGRTQRLASQLMAYLK